MPHFTAGDEDESSYMDQLHREINLPWIRSLPMLSEDAPAPMSSTKGSEFSYANAWMRSGDSA